MPPYSKKPLLSEMDEHLLAGTELVNGLAPPVETPDWLLPPPPSKLVEEHTEDAPVEDVSPARLEDPPEAPARHPLQDDPASPSYALHEMLSGRTRRAPLLLPEPEIQGVLPPTDLPGLDDAKYATNYEADEAEYNPAPPPVTPSAPEPEPDYRAMLGSADAESRQLAIGALINRAGTQVNAAFTNSKPDYAFADRLDALSKEPVSRAQKQMELMRLMHKAKQDRVLKDPQSLESKAAQEAFIRHHPRTAESMGVEHIRGMSADQLKPYVGDEFKFMSLDRQLANDTFNHDDKDRNFHMREASLDNKKSEFLRGQFGKWDEKIKDIVPVVGLMKEVEEIAPGYIRGGEGGIQIADRILQSVPKDAGSNWEPVIKSKLKSAVGLLFKRFSHPMTGSNFTAIEQEQFAKILHDAMLSSPAAQAAALDIVRRETFQRLKSKEAAYREVIIDDPDMWARYQKVGGTSVTDPVFGDLFDAMPFKPGGAEGQGSTAPPIDTSTGVEEPAGLGAITGAAKTVIQKVVGGGAPPKTTKTAEAPASKTLKNGSVWTLQPNGKYKMTSPPTAAAK